ncbi:histidine kinase [Taibaiella soli]|uniref:Signal transduction histidine kinase internal region domain-containing protein n=1 Tax=Taibaiella soli TaxID=1649169 RepID=A0A2W2C1X2_9BACT|nr:histidine kinase [Taibaiella soli]PZF74063.1 hypothetical protein DN068_05055 [Taibaiella soli]
MMQDYIKQELEDKNRFVYFKSGRWAIHVLVWIIIYCVATIEKSQSPLSPGALFYVLFYELGLYIIVYYCYCRCLVPDYFKQGKYFRFWLLLIGTLLLLPAVDLVIHHFLDPFIPQVYREDDGLDWATYGDLLTNTLITFLILSFILYLMEVAEGVGTYRSVDTEIYQRLAAEKELLRTRMQPDFVMRSLDGIALLAEQQNPAAPDALVSFSDILRYRLYFSQNSNYLTEELEQLQQLFHFQKSTMVDGDRCELAVVGDPGSKAIPAFTLINIGEALFSTYDGDEEWSLVFYLLISEIQLEITIELQTSNNTATEVLTNLRESLSTIFNMDCTFTIEQEENNRRINICTPITLL